jgi:glutamyl-tRNA(Gln) amidotransferase subunit D
MTVYESGRDLLDLGIVPLENMIPEVALVKLMWITGNTENYDEIKETMLDEIASEFST